MGAGFVQGKGHGAAMHEAIALIKSLYYGFNERSLFLRIDLNKAFITNMEEVSFEINLLLRGTYKIVYHVKGETLESPLPVRAVFADMLEMEVRFDDLQAKKGDKITLWTSLKIKEMIVDRIPKRGYLAVHVPSDDFEMENWYV